MEKERRWWGWMLRENGIEIGAVSNDGGESRTWNAVNNQNQIIGEFKLRKDAIACVLEFWQKEQNRQNSIFDGNWHPINEIRQVMTDSEFRTKLFLSEVEILGQELGQPRHGEPFGNSRLFRLVKVG